MSNPEIKTIYLEGTDCTGKDAVGEILAKDYKITNIQKLTLCPNNPWDNDKTHELTSDHPLLPIYLIKSIIWDIHHYSSDGLNNKQLQISFTAARSAAWCEASEDEYKNIFSELVKFSPVFQHAFLLTASIKTKQDRLSNRLSKNGVCSHIDNLVNSNPEFVAKMDKALENIFFQDIQGRKICTDNLTISEVGIVVRDTINLQSNNVQVKQKDIFPEINRFQKEISIFTKTIAKKHYLSDNEIEKVNQSLI